MGLCESTEEKYQRLQNEAIEKQLFESGRILERTQKLLLLGAAECGKSTILKQMRILHDNGFSSEEIQATRRIIRENMIESMRIMLTQKNHLGIVPTGYSIRTKSRIVRDQSSVTEDEGEVMFSPELYDALKQLWADKAIQEVYSRRAEFHLSDSTKYFFDDLDRIAAEDYVPNNQDMLLTRAPTLGVTETKFTLKRITFRVFDVGGQRSERRKWIHCFDNVNAIIYICAISEFDQKLMENNETNRLLESLTIFKQIINNSLFSVHCSMILFLNKTDLFAEKIKNNCTITTAFPTYSGPTTFEAQVAFIKAKFMSLKENPKKMIYPHRTCATDTRQVEVVINSVIDSIMSKNIGQSGMH